MVQAGLLMAPNELATLRFWSTLPYAALMAFGAVKLIVGDLRERPVGYLTALLVLTAILALARWFSLTRHTRAGRDAVAHAVARSSLLRRGPTTPEVDLAVALYGAGVLAGSAWSGFRKRFTFELGWSSVNGGDSWSAGGDSWGGGCGGACGGCGG